jgi:hypothetical protein
VGAPRGLGVCKHHGGASVDALGVQAGVAGGEAASADGFVVVVSDCARRSFNRWRILPLSACSAAISACTLSSSTFDTLVGSGSGASRFDRGWLAVEASAPPAMLSPKAFPSDTGSARRRVNRLSGPFVNSFDHP